MPKSKDSSPTPAEDLATEKQRARERIRYVKPEVAGKVLGHDRYWTVQFLRLYLELCDETAFDVPRDAYLLAQHLPEVARRIRVGAEAREWDTPLEKMGGIVMALAVKGSCCRAAEEMEEARLCFSRAFRGLDGRTPPPIPHAELLRRYAALLVVGRDTEEAAQHLERSLEIADASHYQVGYADGLALRGYLRHLGGNNGEALVDFIEASRLADLKSPRGQRTATASMHNLALVIAKGGVALLDQERALKYLHRFKQSLKGTPTSTRKLRTLWVEGLLLSNLQVSRHAERQLKKSRSGFKKLKSYFDYVLVSLDLYSFYVQAGQTEEALDVASETVGLLATEFTPGDPLVTMLDRWAEDGIRSIDELTDLRTEAFTLRLQSK